MKSYFDIVGDGGSGVVEQVVAQRERMARRLAGVRHRVAVGSGKGGVGKSTLTFHLANVLQAQGLRCAVLDADLNGPTQARLAGLGGTPWVPHRDGLSLPRHASGLGVVSVGGLVPESDAVDFESTARGDSHVWRAAREFTALGQLLGSVEWGELDVLWVDLPPGAERTFQYAEFLGAETDFVLVTVPSDLARGVVARSAAALAATPNRVLGAVENMHGYYCPDCRTIKPLFPEARQVPLDLPTLGSVPFDPVLASMCDLGECRFQDPERASLRALRDVATRITHRLGLGEGGGEA